MWKYSMSANSFVLFSSWKPDNYLNLDYLTHIGNRLCANAPAEMKNILFLSLKSIWKIIFPRIVLLILVLLL